MYLVNYINNGNKRTFRLKYAENAQDAIKRVQAMIPGAKVYEVVNGNDGGIEFEDAEVARGN